ncbi:hypothetical protein HWV62_20228 [Athelia sp. TMB]|nr:hypothetical protein HWV62_20228 [Athelia sp. TMB]
MAVVGWHKTRASSASVSDHAPPKPALKKSRAIVISSDEEDGPVSERVHFSIICEVTEINSMQQHACAKACFTRSVAARSNNYADSCRFLDHINPIPLKETHLLKTFWLLADLPTTSLAPILRPSHQSESRFASPLFKIITDPMWEGFDLPEDRHLYDPATSAAEAEKALLELVESHNDDAETEIDMSQAIVDGFREGVLGRAWMKERETGKKLGGILADDMGLGKTIQTLTRIVDGRPKKSDKADGWAAATLVVCPVALVNQWASEIHVAVYAVVGDGPVFRTVLGKPACVGRVNDEIA